MQRPSGPLRPHADLDQRRVNFMGQPTVLAHRPVAKDKGTVVLGDVDVAHPTDHRVGPHLDLLGNVTAAWPLNICLSTFRSRARIVGDWSATSEASASAPRPVAVIAETPWLTSSSGIVNSHDRFIVDLLSLLCFQPLALDMLQTIGCGLQRIV